MKFSLLLSVFLALTYLSDSFIITSQGRTKSVVPRSQRIYYNKPRKNNDGDFFHKSISPTTNRKTFLTQLIIATSTFNLPIKSHAFDGGVGGLGKTKPSTGVVFVNPENNIDTASSISTPGDYNAELLSPDGITPIFLSFYAAWPMLRGSSGIESRDLANPESAFVQVATLPEGKSVSNLPKSLFVDTIFGQGGKYGMYGTPSDIKVSKVRDNNDGRNEGNTTVIYTATFTTLTPAMRESDRKALIAVSSVGNGLFMLVTGTTAARFKGQEKLLNQIADSFVCIEAPKSSFRR